MANKYPLAEQATLRLSKPVSDIVLAGQGVLLEELVLGLKSGQRTGRNASRISVRARVTGWKLVPFLR